MPELEVAVSASAGQGSLTKYAGTDQGEEWGDAKGTPSVLPAHDTTGLRRYTGEASRAQPRRRTETGRVRALELGFGSSGRPPSLFSPGSSSPLGCWSGGARESQGTERSNGVSRVEAALRIVGTIALASVSLG